MTLDFAAKLKLRSRPTNVGKQKIDDLFLKIYNITLASFLF